jgi:hypothetical protein
MTPAFEEGARQSMTKLAADPDWKFRAMRLLARPEIFGAFTGATMGVLVSPDDDRTRYMGTGALIGAGMGFARGVPKRKVPRPPRIPRPKKVPMPMRSGMGGPSTPVGIPARFVT